MEITMVRKNIGLLRNIIAKRKEIIQVVKQYALADDIIVASLSDNQVTVVGHTKGTAETLTILGRVLALSWDSAQVEYPDASLDDFLMQPTKVALTTINKEQKCL